MSKPYMEEHTIMGRGEVLRELMMGNRPPIPPDAPPDPPQVAEAWAPSLDGLQKTFQAALQAQQTALKDIETKIAMAKKHLADLEALKRSWEQQLDHPSGPPEAHG